MFTGVNRPPNRSSITKKANATNMRSCNGRMTSDLILQSTVYSSVLDPAAKGQMASKMLRVVQEDGLILCYDYHVNNPWNPAVRGVKRQEIDQVFPGCCIQLRRVVLAPLFARLLAPYSWLAYYVRERIPWLCANYLGVIRKGEAVAARVPAVRDAGHR
jgi:hypothetical protein